MMKSIYLPGRYNSQIYPYFIVLSYFQYSVLIIMFIVYPLFPIIYSSEKYFQKRGYENTVIEYERVKKIIYYLLPVFVLALLYVVHHIVRLPVNGDLEGILLPQIFQQNSIYTIYTDPYVVLRGTLMLVFASALLKTTFLMSKKDFRFYFARGCMRVVSKKEDELEKMRYLIKSLKSYNRYISKELRLKIDDFRIYSKIIATKEISESMKLVTEAFEGDKLDAINHLSGFLEDHDNQPVVATDSFGNRLQHLGTDIGGVISAIVGIIGAVIAIITLVKH